MAYTDFTLESAESELGVTSIPGDLFPDLQPVPVSAWLLESLSLGTQLALTSEKARSEYIVAPVLLSVRELSHRSISILSGQRLDVDPARRLVGECDFLLSRSAPVPRLRAPVMSVVEAKRHDIEGGLGQCIAQMVAADVYNARAGEGIGGMFGCVTTGEIWQFLRLEGSAVVLHQRHLYIDNVGLILGAFGRAIGSVVHRPA